MIDLKAFNELEELRQKLTSSQEDVEILLKLLRQKEKQIESLRKEIVRRDMEEHDL